MTDIDINVEDWETMSWDFSNDVDEEFTSESEPEYVENRFVGKIKILLVYSVVDLNIVERSLEVILNVI